MGIDFKSYGEPRLELGAALQEYRVNQDTFIGTKLFTMTPVMKKAAKYPVITRESLTMRADTVRAPRGAYNRTNFQTKDKDFSCVEHGLEGQLDASERSLYKSDLDAEMATTQDIFNKILREQEIRIAALAFNASTWTGAPLFTDCHGWADTTDAKPIDDVQNAKLKVFQNCGLEANTLVLSRTNLTYLLQNAQIVGRVKEAQVAGWNVLMNMLANLLGIDRILVGNGVYNAKPEGETAASISQIWSDDYAMVAVVSGGTTPIEPTVGRTFLWTDDSPENVTAESYDEPQTRSTVFRVRQNTDEQVIDAYFGHLLGVGGAS